MATLLNDGHGGFINADHVAQFKAAGRGGMRAYSPAGELMGTVNASEVCEQRFTADTMAPDRTGTVIVMVWLEQGMTEPELDRLPVVGWTRTYGGRALPVSVRELSEDWLMELPEGFGPCRWVDEDGCGYWSLKQAVAAAVENIKSRREEAEAA